MPSAASRLGETIPAFFAPLEGLRGLAALGVVLYHTHYLWHINAVGIVVHGNLFVDLFFVISGFVIAHIYAFRLRDRHDLAKFALLRTARLYPLHLFTLLLVLAYTLGTRWAVELWDLPVGPAYNHSLANNTPGAFLSNLLLAQTLLPYHPSFNRPSWSISAEYYTYILFALVALAGAYRRKLLLPACLLLAVVPLGFLMWHGNLVHNAPLQRCFTGFFTGTLAYAAWRAWHTRVEQALGRGWRAHAAQLGAVALAIAAMWNAGRGASQFLVIPAFALLVFLLADSTGVVTGFIRHRYILNLGKWSYSIYMMHFIVMLIVTDAVHLLWQQGPQVFMTWPTWASSLFTLLVVVLVLAVASLTFRHIEDPPRQWARRWAAHRWGRDRATEQDRLVGAP